MHCGGATSRPPDPHVRSVHIVTPHPHRKLRSEKGELVEELERANGDKRQLTEEKAKLLTELAER